VGSQHTNCFGFEHTNTDYCLGSPLGPHPSGDLLTDEFTTPGFCPPVFRVESASEASLVQTAWAEDSYIFAFYRVLMTMVGMSMEPRSNRQFVVSICTALTGVVVFSTGEWAINRVGY
jgi:hypothetical protein